MSTNIIKQHADCAKFSPNIFNKTKCQNCFRPKEVHSAEALESNRASRRVSKCGYLFVAPDWDFSVSINRTKRWQRRWFVLYDDGELTYSVDEHPDTIPQAIIDVNLVLEVSDAEEVTGNKYAIAITAQDKVHFIKGTSQEESKRWFDVLSMYPRSMRGRHKRNATFPGIKATTTINQPKSNEDYKQSEQETLRPRFNSCQSTDDRDTVSKENVPPEVWTGEETVKDNLMTSPGVDYSNLDDYLRKCDKITDELDSMEKSSVAKSETTETSQQPTVKSRRYHLRQSRGLRNQRSKSDGVAKMFPLALDCPRWVDDLETHSRSNERSNGDALNIRSLLKDPRISSPESDGSKSPLSTTKDNSKRRSKVVFSGNEIDYVRIRKTSDSEKKKVRNDGGYGLSGNKESRSEQRYHQRRSSKLSRSNSNSSSSSNSQYVKKDSVGGSEESSMRGVPDGCGNDTDAVSSSCLSINTNHISISIEGDEKVRKGWLMKHDSVQDWSRHWFVLRGTAFMFYRDPTCEKKGILDGFVDLSLVQNIEEADCSKYSGFKIITWDNRRYVFSAVNLTLRNSWLQALLDVANVESNFDVQKLSGSQRKVDDDVPYGAANNKSVVGAKDKDERHVNVDSENKCLSVLLPNPVQKSKSLDAGVLSKNWKADEIPMNKVTRNNSAMLVSDNRALPPSPPVTRTPISRVKDKARSRSNSRSRSQKSKSISSPVLISDDTEVPPNDVNSGKSQSKSFENDKKGMSNGDIVLVDLLETEVESLRTRLEDAQKELVILHQTNIDLQAKFASQNSSKTKNVEWNEGCESGECSSIIQSLSDECQRLRNDGNTLREDVHKLQTENSKLKKDQDELSRIREDVADFKAQCNWKEIVIERQRSEVLSLKKNLEMSKDEITNLFGKLGKYNKDKHVLTVEIHELESRIETLEKRPKASPSLMITEDYEKETELDQARLQLAKAQTELRGLKKELRQAHCSYDELELFTMKMKHDMDALKQENQSVSRMMAERIEDLASKLSTAERAVRQLKQKLSKAENRQERRTRSLRGGKDSLTISKEMEAKLTELENKMGGIERVLQTPDDKASETPDCQKDGKQEKENVFLRLNVLSSRVASAMKSPTDDVQKQSVRAGEGVLTDGEGLVQQLRMKLKYTENIMEACKQKLFEVFNRMSEVDCRCSSRNGILELKEDLGAIHDVILGQCSSSGSDCKRASRLCKAVGKMKRLLYAQTKQMYNQRRKLKAAGMHTAEIESKLIKEKLALETAVIKYMTRVIHSPEHGQNTATFWVSELQTLFTCLEEVETVMTSANVKKMFSKIQRVLGSILCSPIKSDAETIAKNLCTGKQEVPEPSQCLNEIQNQFEVVRTQCHQLQKSLDDVYRRKMHVVLESLISAGNDPPTSDVSNIKHAVDLLRFHGAWDVAKDVVDEAVVKSEMQSLMSNLSGVYRDCMTGDDSSAPCWCMSEFQDVFLSRKQLEIISHLDDGVKRAVDEIVPEMSKIIASNRQSFYGHMSKESHEMFEEAVAIIACKAVISGHLTAIEAFINNRPSCDDLQALTDDGLNDQVEGLIQSVMTNAELSCILNQVQFDQSNRSSPGTDSSDTKVAALQRKYDELFENERESFVDAVSNLQEQVSILENEKSNCRNCERVLDEHVARHDDDIQKIHREHDAEKKALEDRHRESMVRANDERDGQTNEHKKQIKALSNQIQSLESHYEDQTRRLRAGFEAELTSQLKCSIGDDIVKRQYESEIEQLKTLCKMGFSAMEKCHKHVIKDLEDKHHDELELLRNEQKQALADETRATIAALDAIKKAHEAEIQKELARVKEQMTGTKDVKSDELDRIKEEIRRITETFSNRNDQTTTIVQDKMNVLTRQLAESNSQILDLKARNNQLRSYLSKDADGRDPGDGNQVQKLLKMKESEILKKTEELSDVKYEIGELRESEKQLQERCNQLQETMKVKKKVKEDEMKIFLAKLEAVASKSDHQADEPGTNITGNIPMPDLRKPLSYAEHKYRRPFKNLTFTYKRDYQPTGILDGATTLKSDV